MGNRISRRWRRNDPLAGCRVATWQERLQQTPPELPYKLPAPSMPTTAASNPKRNKKAASKQKSPKNVIQSQQKQKCVEPRRTLPTELLYEIAKWIPLKIELSGPEEKPLFDENSDDFTFPSTIGQYWAMEAKRRAMRAMYLLKSMRKKFCRPAEKPQEPQKPFCIKPLNERMLLASTNLTTIFGHRCEQLNQKIATLSTDYVYDCDSFENYILVKRKNAVNENGQQHEATMSMLEMMRHICYGQLCSPDTDKSYLFAEHCGTMPADFEPGTFIDLLMQFTRWTPNSRTVFRFKICLNDEQCRCALAEMETRRADMYIAGVNPYRNAELGWLNAHNPMDREFHLYLKKEKDDNFHAFTIAFAVYGIDFF